MLNTFEDFEREASKYQQIIINYREKGEVYTDPNFHPAKNIPETDTSFSTYTQWKRIDEIYKAPLFKQDLIGPDFISQGCLGNCYFVSALIQLSTQPYLVPYLFDHKANIYIGKEEDSINIKCGAVIVYLHAFGRKTPILIDTLIPTSFGSPIFSKLKDPTKSGWFCLVEKAYAKLYGSYSEIAGGTLSQSIYALYGYYSRSIAIFMISKDKLFEKILKNKNKGLPISAEIDSECTSKEITNEEIEKKGLHQSHNYLIQKAVQIEGKNLICLRNPWGCGEWNGDWSDKSDLLTPEMKEKLNHKTGDDGTFWMIDTDFVKYFTCLFICKPIPESYKERVLYYELLPKLEETKYLTTKNLPQIVFETICEGSQKVDDSNEKFSGKFIVIAERRHKMFDEDGNLNPKPGMFCAPSLSKDLFSFGLTRKLLSYPVTFYNKKEHKEFGFVRSDLCNYSDDLYVSVFYNADFKLYINDKPEFLAPEIDRSSPFDNFSLVKKPYLLSLKNSTKQEKNKEFSKKEDESKKVDKTKNQEKRKIVIRPLKKVTHKSFHLNSSTKNIKNEYKMTNQSFEKSKESEILDIEKQKKKKNLSQKQTAPKRPIKRSQGETESSIRCQKIIDVDRKLDEQSLKKRFNSIRDKVISSYFEDN